MYAFHQYNNLSFMLLTRHRLFIFVLPGIFLWHKFCCFVNPEWWHPRGPATLLSPLDISIMVCYALIVLNVHYKLSPGSYLERFCPTVPPVLDRLLVIPHILGKPNENILFSFPLSIQQVNFFPSPWGYIAYQLVWLVFLEDL